ncbi:TonB-dependent receptor [Chryseosolibacter indicus]|uniref:TonB-dependent receptor n=1 Tax=Chryseosolibacter indicus TaxID=2782351 RepID=A0ABS5VPD7_9BACT|nr:TonB-dependent receptor [Chryseosolibacter indicus]MBT1703317.1 TonB-dependent receptor [Chryseosolibacter indicus]
MKIIILILFLFSLNHTYCQTTKITGTVTDELNNPIVGANILLKGKVTGTATDVKGKFEFNTTQTPPFTIIVSMVGFQKQELVIATVPVALSVTLVELNEVMDEVVVSASRVEENILQSPISIEKMDLRDIMQTPSISFYDALENLKGVEMVTSGLTFKQINTRGFNHTGNSRFLQLVDGADNQTPGLGFSVGNMFGSSDLDMESAELIPGAASALYGPIAFNGVLMMKTKDPFQYQGLSAQTKVGVNHINEDYADPHIINDYAIRYAKAFNNKFAFKLNASYFSGLDFYAVNYTDVDSSTPPEQRGDNNPARNALNIYGDDEARTIEGIGRVSRTGYEERHLTDYDVYSLKLNGALHYRISENMIMSYQYNFGQGTANYTGSNRFSINNFTLQQHKLELKGANYFVRAYSTAEDSHDSYNAKGLGQLINKTWVRDLNGNIVPENQADDMWFTRYEEAFLGNIAGINPGNHDAARTFADQGRFLPGSAEFIAQKERLVATQGLSGAGILSQSKLYHVEGQYDFSKKIKLLDLQVGGNFRRYDMFTNGTLFDDKNGSIVIDEGGAFVQLGKKLLNEKLKLGASLRYDKNQNFDGRFTPRASAVYTVSGNHHIRLSYQTGFRNPTPGDQYIKLNAGPITILGGVPDNSKGMTVYQNSFTSASLGPFFGAFQQAMQQGATPQDALMQAKDLLVKSNVDYIKPERIKAFEIGYKGLFNSNLLIDANYYFSSYTDFLLNQVVMEPQNPVLTPDGAVNAGAAMDLLNGDSHLYQLYTNAADQVTAQGATLGVTYALPKNFLLSANATLATFDIRDANPNNVPGFNTPKYKTALTFGNSKVTKTMGFNIAWRWQDAYDWYGTFNQMRPGRIEAFSIVDAQINYKLLPVKSMFKVGANNLFNKQVYQAYGSPSIGAIYYISLTFDQLLR